MLDGYESSTSRTVQVDVGRATLMIIFAVAENTNRINLAAQHEEREMMMKQAKLHHAGNSGERVHKWFGEDKNRK
jgi:hypothetical protein